MLNLHFINNDCIEISLGLVGYHQGHYIQPFDVQKVDMAKFKIRRNYPNILC